MAFGDSNYEMARFHVLCQAANEHSLPRVTFADAFAFKYGVYPLDEPLERLFRSLITNEEAAKMKGDIVKAREILQALSQMDPRSDWKNAPDVEPDLVTFGNFGMAYLTAWRDGANATRRRLVLGNLFPNEAWIVDNRDMALLLPDFR